MVDFFPPGFWKVTAMVGMIVFFIVGLDLLLGARLVSFLGQTMNRKFHIDPTVVKALSDLKENSDKEFDTERTLLHSWGRFIASGVLFFCALLMMTVLIPRLK